MPPREHARVLIVEDRPVLNAQTRATLASHPELEMLGQVTSALEAARLAHSLTPDMVVCSTNIADPGAFELARFFRLRLPEAVIVFVTPTVSEDELFEAVRVGVAAYLPGSTPGPAFVSTLERASRGEFQIDQEVVRHPAVASRILAQFRLRPPDLDLAARTADRTVGAGQFRPRGEGADKLAPLFVPLSAREIEILQLVAQGNSNKLIARRLGISDQTVKNHVTAILRKLEVNDRTEAVVYAIRNGWIRIDATARSSR